MRLLIATINNASFSVALGEEKMARFKIVEKEYKQSEMLLKTIEDLIKKQESQKTCAIGASAFGGKKQNSETTKQRSTNQLINYSTKQLNSQISKQQISNIFVAEGPGAFSALRIGIATANALAYALNIPVVGLRLKSEWKDLSAEEQLKKLWQLGSQKLKKGSAKQFIKAVEPFYGQAPHITVKKR